MFGNGNIQPNYDALLNLINFWDNELFNHYPGPGVYQSTIFCFDLIIYQFELIKALLNRGQVMVTITYLHYPMPMLPFMVARSCRRRLRVLTVTSMILLGSNESIHRD